VVEIILTGANLVVSRWTSKKYNTRKLQHA